MGLDYDYRIYVKKEKLKKAVQYVFQNCEKSRSGIEFINGEFYRLNRVEDRVKRTKIENVGINQNFDCCLIFPNDEKLWEYYLNDLAEGLDPESEEICDRIDYYQVDSEHFWIGNIEMKINDYSNKIKDFVEIKFVAVTSSMSELFRDSTSIDSFFKQLCKEVDAEYGYLSKESEGYKLIWYEGKEMNVHIKNTHWKPYEKFGFIPTIKMIMKTRRK